MSKRDEFSCPCCGAGTDSSYCVACDVFECGEQDVGTPDKCLVPANVTATRVVHAAHYKNCTPPGGHDLLVVEVTISAGKETPFDRYGNPEVRPAGLSMGFQYHSGSRINGLQSWRFVKTAPLSPGKCGRCA